MLGCNWTSWYSGYKYDLSLAGRLGSTQDQDDIKAIREAAPQFSSSEITRLVGSL
eukprot:SAG31_NODE_8487_length_1442_cov_1.461653_2_plen_55_part_00